MATVRMPCEHPVDDGVRKLILAELERIEQEHSVHIVLACEAGSRSYGFASPNSDYDVRFVFVRRPERYLTVKPDRDCIERPIDSVLDMTGWDMRKALQLAGESNPSLLEWVQSPIVYREEAEVAQQLRRLTSKHYARDRTFHHYLSMARNNDRDHLRAETVHHKKYMHVLRPLLAVRWVLARDDPPPVAFADLAAEVLPRGTDEETALFDCIHRLLTTKMSSDRGLTGPPIADLRTFIDRETAAALLAAPKKTTRPDHTDLDAFLSDCVLRQCHISPTP